MTENRGNLQQYAMLFGTYLGIFWILKFILFPLGLTVPFLLFLFWGLTIGVPFMAYYYVRMYRTHACGGFINFFHGWIFSVFMYMFAALLTAVAHYIYFEYIDQGFVFNTINNVLDEGLRQNLYPDKSTLTMYKEYIEELRSMPSIELCMQIMSMNVFYGSLAAIPIALFVMKRPPSSSTPAN